MTEILKNKALNGWKLFWLITTPISIAMIIAMAGADLASGEGVSSMIQLSVRCAVPLLYVTFAASAIQKLFPGRFGGWLLRNRKYIGLSFAAAMGWQGFFILWLVTIHADYYVNEVYVLRDAIEGVVGYTFLSAMVFTSFRFGRSLLSARQWRLLHLVGIYYVWAYAFAVYWWNLFYYENPVTLDYIYYWAGFLGWALRAAAWSKRRHAAAGKDATPAGTQAAIALTGVLIIAAGLVAASFGRIWYAPVESVLTGYAITQIPETYLPYWPFFAYLPLFMIASGALVISKARA